MPSYAKWAVVALAVTGAMAVHASAVYAQGASALESTLRAEVARLWGVSPSGVRVELQTAVPAGLACCASVRIGGGRSGYRSAVVDPTEGRPLAVRFRAGTVREVRVATREILRGDTLGATDLESVEAVVWGRPASSPSRFAESGWVARARIAPGDQVVYPEASPPPAVHPGDAVRVLIVQGEATATLTGVALGRGRLGDRVQVRLDDGRGIQTGVLDRPDVVRVSAPTPL